LIGKNVGMVIHKIINGVAIIKRILFPGTMRKTNRKNANIPMIANKEILANLGEAKYFFIWISFRAVKLNFILT